MSERLHPVSSHKGTKAQNFDPARLEDIAKIVVDCGYRLHRDLGLGLLESAYEILLCASLKERGLRFAQQVPVPIHYLGTDVPNGFRLDILVEDVLVVELKSTERHAPVHAKQLLTYLRLLELPLGLLMNFGAPTYKEGIRRIANNYFGPQA